MRKKSTDETYLKGVSKYKVIIKEIKEQNAYIVLKKIIEIDEPFVKNITLIDNGYYVMEYTPMDKMYNGRVFIDNNLNAISYYFDISLGNGVEDGKPYYDDLYLDIIYGIETGNIVKILDEDELLEALKSGQITQQNYELAYSICSKLTSEIKEKRNVLINMDKKQVIKKLKI